MKDKTIKTIKTIRLKNGEAISLKELAFNLTKEAILNGYKTIYTESDLVHFLIENYAKEIALDKSGNLYLIINKDNN